ncbi:MAG: GHKL domain-containing protein [Chloroflexi bacterium]|nr:GHKL domain-containing protein [Chloroflexota bacterium]
MPNKPVYNEPLSTLLRRPHRGDEKQIMETLQWVARSSLLILFTFGIVKLIAGKFTETIIVLFGAIPILISIQYIKKGMVSRPSAILAVTTILLITYLATIGAGVYDVALIGYPVIMIVAGLILRGRVIPYMTGLIILCLGWLVFGDLLEYYDPDLPTTSSVVDLFYASAIILVASNAIYLLAKNIYDNLRRIQEEVEEREKAELAREELIRQLKLKNQELDRFAITVSHDLKTPLITIAGFLGFLERDALSGNKEQIGRSVTQINKAAQKMGTLVDEILDLSRVGRFTNPPTDVPFAKIVSEAVNRAEGLFKTQHVQLEIEREFPLVHVDEARMVQVLQNLLTNAVKFMGKQANPRIQIGCDQGHAEAVFFVKDNGMGISPQYHEQIFGLFSKLDTSTEGTGIGLGLVKRIIEVHGGRIWVESEIGKGSTFFFTLKNQNDKETSWLES